MGFLHWIRDVCVSSCLLQEHRNSYIHVTDWCWRNLLFYSISRDFAKKLSVYSFLLTNANAKGNYELETYPTNKMVALNNVQNLSEKHRIYMWHYCTHTFSHFSSCSVFTFLQILSFLSRISTNRKHHWIARKKTEHNGSSVHISGRYMTFCTEVSTYPGVMMWSRVRHMRWCILS